MEGPSKQSTNEEIKPKKNFFITPEKADKLAEEKKKLIFDSIKYLVIKKRKRSPNFKLTLDTLDEMIKTTPKMFTGLTSVYSVSRYWGGSVIYLREKIDNAIREDIENETKK